MPWIFNTTRGFAISKQLSFQYLFLFPLEMAFKTQGISRSSYSQRLIHWYRYFESCGKFSVGVFIIAVTNMSFRYIKKVCSKSLLHLFVPFINFFCSWWFLIFQNIPACRIDKPNDDFWIFVPYCLEKSLNCYDATWQISHPQVDLDSVAAFHTWSYTIVKSYVLDGFFLSPMPYLWISPS